MIDKVIGSAVVLGSLTSYVTGQGGSVCGYAPLCGDDNVVFDWETGDFPFGGQVIGAAEINFEDCCSLADTQPTQDCQIVDPSGESQRIATASQPLCGNNGNKCKSGSCDQYYFTVKPYFIKDSTNDGCCDSCSCYGDPICRAFNGKESTWVLCDGREIPREDSIFDQCKITERRCSKELDHAGNTCEYLSDDDKGNGWIVGKQGSPCVPSSKSPPSKIIMYQVPDADFKFTLQQGDRGIITNVFLELSSGSFSLSAEECLHNGKNAWTHTTDKLPEFFSYEDSVRGLDELWNIIDPQSGIAINIRCHGNVFEGDDNVYVARINVEDLSDPIARRPNTGGFCKTAKFEYGKATTAHTQKIIDGKHCAEGLQESDARDIYREICENPAMTQSGIPSCRYHFCSKYFAPLFNTVEECEAKMEVNLAEGFCMGVTYTDSDVIKCVNQWNTGGAIPTIQQYYNNQAGCTTHYQTTLEKCQSGVLIQFERDSGWFDAIAIPDDYCGPTDEDGGIRISYCDFPQLFNRRIRIIQKESNIVCRPVSQCSRVNGFRGFIGLTLDTPAPTPYPTLQPTTDAPTSSPVYETGYPSPYPTDYPTTGFPSQYPTLFPSGAPVDYPTGYPTAFPTFADQPGGCPQGPLCGTQSTYQDIDENGEFHFQFPECCSKSDCPPQQNSEKNRTSGSSNPYCGSDDSHTGKDCKNTDELTVMVSFEREGECCKSCTCFGDPRCYSFSGHFEEFILCDGREIADEPTERCVIRKETCEAQKDHEGNACKWYIPGRPGLAPNYADAWKQGNEENHFDIAKYGSPCRYDASASDVPTLLLYQVEGFRVEVEHGDRGYITSVSLTTSNGDFEMSADRCLAGKNWEIFSGAEGYKQFTQLKFGKEYLWKVFDISTNIEMRIRCTGNLVGNDYTNMFINIEAIEEPDVDRITTADGFCATDILPKGQSTWRHTKEITDGGLCDNWNEDMTPIIQREVARIIVDDPGVTQTGTVNAYTKFCERFFSPGWESVSKCVKDFTGNTKVHGLIKAFCNAVTSESAACEENMEVLAESNGYIYAFQSGYLNYIENFNDQCEFKPKNLPAKLTQDEKHCETGVELQFYNPRKDEWVTYLAFPDNSAPCKGYTVTFKYSDDPKLFKNRLRLIQKQNFLYCSACTFPAAVDAWFTFN